MPSKRTILFINLGGPETQADVKSFLFRLFADPEVIRIRSKPLRYFVAWLIATVRQKKSKALYATIGGGSPIRRLTDLQAAGAELVLRASGHDVRVRTAFTCSAPLIEDVVKAQVERGVQHFLALPLYPQYSLTTTKGSLDRAHAAVKKFGNGATLTETTSWPTHPLFIRAHADLIREKVGRFSEPDPEKIHLLFSAHSIPEKLVTELGDPYQKEMERTVAAIVAELGWKGQHSLAWQSRLGPVKWLGPSTPDVIEKLGKEGVQQVLAVPVAFVSDHIETLNEIDMLFKDMALKAGIREFLRTPGLNDNPTFLRALADIASTQKEFWDEGRNPS